MSMIYRNSGDWGAGKGGNLTSLEVDANFYFLKQLIDSLGAGPAPAEIDTITVSGSQMTITLDDLRVFGPFTLPRSRFRWRGEWAASTEYAGNDVVRRPTGIYLINYTHTSPASWDAEHVASGETDDAYVLMFPGQVGTVVAVGSTTYVPASSIPVGYFRCTDDAGCAVTLPPASSDEFPIGSELSFVQRGAAAVTLAGDTGVTVNVPTGFTAATSFVGGVLKAKNVAADEWDISGDLATV